MEKKNPIGCMRRIFTIENLSLHQVHQAENPSNAPDGAKKVGIPRMCPIVLLLMAGSIIQIYFNPPKNHFCSLCQPIHYLM